MSERVRLRPLEQGELGESWDQEAEYDDFGPRRGYLTPPPCALDEQGVLNAGLAIEERAGFNHRPERWW